MPKFAKMTSPTWTDETKTAIRCFVFFEGDNRRHSYVLKKDDKFASAEQLWNDLQSGKYGPVVMVGQEAEVEKPESPDAATIAAVLEHLKHHPEVATSFGATQTKPNG